MCVVHVVKTQRLWHSTATERVILTSAILSCSAVNSAFSVSMNLIMYNSTPLSCSSSWENSARALLSTSNSNVLSYWCKGSKIGNHIKAQTGHKQFTSVPPGLPWELKFSSNSAISAACSAPASLAACTSLSSSAANSSYKNSADDTISFKIQSKKISISIHLAMLVMSCTFYSHSLTYRTTVAADQFSHCYNLTSSIWLSGMSGTVVSPDVTVGGASADPKDGTGSQAVSPPTIWVLAVLPLFASNKSWRDA